MESAMTSNQPARPLALLAAILAALSLSGCGDREAEEAKRTEEALIKGFTQVADEFNAKGPTMMDEHTRLDSTKVGPGARISYFYSLPKYASADFADMDFLAEVSPEIKKGTCNDADIKKTLEQGATYSFIYSGNDGVEIARLDLTQDVCAQP
jgi:hypothetical protein